MESSSQVALGSTYARQADKDEVELPRGGRGDLGMGVNKYSNTQVNSPGLQRCVQRFRLPVVMLLVVVVMVCGVL